MTMGGLSHCLHKACELTGTPHRACNSNMWIRRREEREKRDDLVRWVRKRLIINRLMCTRCQMQRQGAISTTSLALNIWLNRIHAGMTTPHCASVICAMGCTTLPHPCLGLNYVGPWPKVRMTGLRERMIALLIICKRSIVLVTGPWSLSRPRLHALLYSNVELKMNQSTCLIIHNIATSELTNHQPGDRRIDSKKKKKKNHQPSEVHSLSMHIRAGRPLFKPLWGPRRKYLRLIKYDLLAWECPRANRYPGQISVYKSHIQRIRITTMR